jgi:hypothetical protein
MAASGICCSISRGSHRKHGSRHTTYFRSPVNIYHLGAASNKSGSRQAYMLPTICPQPRSVAQVPTSLERYLVVLQIQMNLHIMYKLHGQVALLGIHHIPIVCRPYDR